MKKNILIAMLALLTLTFFVYAQIKANDAIKTQLEAEANLKFSQENARKADIEAEKAMDAAAEALNQKSIAEKLMAELQECK